MQLSRNAEQITVVAEDDYGNIIKKKLMVADLDKNVELIKDSKSDMNLSSGKQERDEIKKSLIMENSEELGKTSAQMSNTQLSADETERSVTENDSKVGSTIDSRKVLEPKSKTKHDKEPSKSIVDLPTATSDFTETRDKEFLSPEDAVHSSRRMLDAQKMTSGSVIPEDAQQKAKVNDDNSDLNV